MDQQTQQNADYLDIIFYKRNKIYGGYELRRHYNRRMGKAFSGLMLCMGALVFLSFINAKPPVESGRKTAGPYIITEVILPDKPPVVLPPKTIIPPPPPEHVAVKTATLTPPVLTDDDVPDDKHMSTAKNLQNSSVGMHNAVGDSSDNGLIPSDTHGTDKKVIAFQPKQTEPVYIVDQMPVFSGDLEHYIGSHMQYPEAARSAGIEGRVVVKFVVNEDGSVSDTQVVRSLGGGCDAEALRMVVGMPKWKPGKQNGVPVKVYFTLPINFQLQ